MPMHHWYLAAYRDVYGWITANAKLDRVADHVTRLNRLT